MTSAAGFDLASATAGTVVSASAADASPPGLHFLMMVRAAYVSSDPNVVALVGKPSPSSTIAKVAGADLQGLLCGC